MTKTKIDNVDWRNLNTSIGNAMEVLEEIYEEAFGAANHERIKDVIILKDTLDTAYWHAKLLSEEHGKEKEWNGTINS